MVTKDIVSMHWASTWYEEQIVVIPQEEKDTETEYNSTKRKAAPQPSKSTSNNKRQQEQTKIHHAHTTSEQYTIGCSINRRRKKNGNHGITSIQITGWTIRNENINSIIK
jgi:hypothetical protein